jgi:hypothetical protein
VVFIVQREAIKSRKAVPSQQEKAWRSTSRYHSGCTRKDHSGYQLIWASFAQWRELLPQLSILTGGNGEVDGGAQEQRL